MLEEFFSFIEREKMNKLAWDFLRLTISSISQMHRCNQLVIYTYILYKIKISFVFLFFNLVRVSVAY